MSENGSASPLGPFDWLMGGTITHAQSVADAIQTVAVGLRGGEAFTIKLADRGQAPPLTQTYRVAPAKPVDAMMNARLRDCVAQVLQFTAADVLQVKPEAARFLPAIDALFREMRAILDDKPRIILPGGMLG